MRSYNVQQTANVLKHNNNLYLAILPFSSPYSLHILFSSSMHLRPISPPCSDDYPLQLLLFRLTLLSLHSSYACSLDLHLTFLSKFFSTLTMHGFPVRRHWSSYRYHGHSWHPVPLNRHIISLVSIPTARLWTTLTTVLTFHLSKHIPCYFPENYVQIRKGIN